MEYKDAEIEILRDHNIKIATAGNWYLRRGMRLNSLADLRVAEKLMEANLLALTAMKESEGAEHEPAFYEMQDRILPMIRDQIKQLKNKH